MFQGLDWLEVLLRGVRNLFGFQESDHRESFNKAYNVAAAVLVLVLVSVAVIGAVAMMAR